MVFEPVNVHTVPDFCEKFLNYDVIFVYKQCHCRVSKRWNTLKDDLLRRGANFRQNEPKIRKKTTNRHTSMTFQIHITLNCYIFKPEETDLFRVKNAKNLLYTCLRIRHRCLKNKNRILHSSIIQMHQITSTSTLIQRQRQHIHNQILKINHRRLSKTMDTLRVRHNRRTKRTTATHRYISSRRNQIS